MGRSTAQWVRSQGLAPRVSPQKDDWQPPSYTEIYPDPDGEKSIMSSVVYCIHHKEGCKWTDELRKLKAHLNTCKHDAMPCTNACGANIPHLMMEDHLQFTCPRRRVRCEHCSTEFSGQTLEAYGLLLIAGIIPSPLSHRTDRNGSLAVQYNFRRLSAAGYAVQHSFRHQTTSVTYGEKYPKEASMHD